MLLIPFALQISDLKTGQSLQKVRPLVKPNPIFTHTNAVKLKFNDYQSFETYDFTGYR